ncbi:lipopolysaccharide biosynthesis protein [Oceanomicrobium pacificus]|uniref:Oligosaccharide flippase family protein n=1 Tax=Oceanomicrobium pacificus TaxID=2692916 RepID=A0A6B0TL12_9RHOB|nr:oligosaccharide flippase family protein [Oceanomicrobium pacificus]MXU65210.1 oligosaccharide flippase family protein [Oceanomicrobium pacificus]
MTVLRGLRDRIRAEDTFKRLARNFSWLFSAHMAIALLGLVSLAVTARALGPAALGILAIVESYVRIIDRLFRLEPLQAVIKYGVDPLEASDRDRFLRLVKLSFLVDLCGGVLAGTIAIGFAGLAAPHIGLEEAGSAYLVLVAAALFLSFQPTGLSVLRLFDRFDLLAKIDTGVAALRLVLCVLAWAAGWGIWAFLTILFVQSVATNLVTFSYSLRELSRRGFDPFWIKPMKGVIEENSGFVRFLWNSNINVILRQSTQRFDTILLALVVDPVIVGYFHIAKRSSNAALRFGRPLRQAIYPDIARLWSAGQFDRFRTVVFITSGGVLAVMFVVFLPVMFYAGPLVALVFGQGYADAAGIVTIQALAVVLYLGGIILNPTLLAMGCDRQLVRVTFVATIMFFAGFLPMAKLFGGEGAAMAHLMFNVVWLVGCLIVFRRYGTGGPSAGTGVKQRSD